MNPRWTALLDDLRDRRGSVKPSDHGWLDLGKVALPSALLVVTNLTDLARHLFGALNDRWISALAPSALTLLAVFIIMAREDLLKVGEPPLILGQTSRIYYRYPRVMRLSAKVVLPLFLLAAVYAWWIILPNGLKGSPYLAGYICDAEGRPVTEGLVEVFDIGQSPLSRKAEALEDTGFFMADLAWWGQTPESLKVWTGTCGESVIPVFPAVNSPQGCPNADRVVERPVESFSWRLLCQKEAKKPQQG